MKTAVVTGANRGIGLEVCRQLAQAGYHLVLTARDEGKGRKAVEVLLKENLNVEFFLLDVTNNHHIRELADFLKKKYGVLDALVNNAAIIGSRESVSSPSTDEIRQVMETNYFGPMMLIKWFIPLLKESDDGRIVNVSTGMGAWSDLEGNYAAYRLSKVGLNALTVMFANELHGTRVKVNAVCPGWVKTDMGGANAPRTVEQGADTIVWTVTHSPMPTGKFFRNRREISF
jgi:NAD(P)-dependent dehydrogenase (short-subunit alcohol dehydrogenase family)